MMETWCRFITTFNCSHSKKLGYFTTKKLFFIHVKWSSFFEQSCKKRKVWNWSSGHLREFWQSTVGNAHVCFVLNVEIWRHTRMINPQLFFKKQKMHNSIFFLWNRYNKDYFFTSYIKSTPPRSIKPNRYIARAVTMR